MGDGQAASSFNAPENVDAEFALLGAIFTNGARVMPMVEEYLRPEHFYDGLNGILYEGALRLFAQGVNPDPLIIRNQIAETAETMRCDPNTRIADCLTAMVGITNAGDYARAIFDAWTRRQLRDICVDVSRQCMTPGGLTSEDLVEQMESALLEIAQGMRESAPNMTISQAIMEAIRTGRDNLERGAELAGLSWGYRGLDRMTGGLLPEALYVIGARPAMGKTALGLGIGMRVAAGGERVLVWSGEMAGKQIGARAGAAWAGLSTMSVFSGRRYDIPEDVETGQRFELEKWQWEALQEGERAAQSVPLELDTRAGLTVAQLRACASHEAFQAWSWRDRAGLCRADARDRGCASSRTV